MGEVYLKCGADILLNGLKTDLKAEARCPVCGTITWFRVTVRQIGDLAPKDPVLHVVEFEVSPGHLGVECKSTHIFDKKECFKKWQSTYAGKPGRVLSLPEYMGSLNQRPPRKVSPA
jgi:Alkylmercury lyase